ncbi:MAG: CDP-diacylglycerol--glycerol-3-phosphate 3-phosphatidyltransferase [Candidatus Omnitrophica bacterium]|nr:CDP-diacylglycerol--glycerol-3-phosphate 3-phosphatidyltransferase [Candidatus Omnitrophota bacterium]MBU1524375.1 CDP-diacylglycerol--glycerol-3-phosphate 3-phosphatidyltransferase [Candidatus Omnitrophota bacterium]MBU2504631.1 CDP-diacylglycerol--glycerol-3-phosphate 3-phosphatidyltransferase [Candidatus Omnitrophota bacterium]
MNIANKLTFLRIILAFVCMGFILKNTFISLLFAFVIFILASLTDFLDGFLARKKELVSDLGKLLDPIADKMLVLGVFLAFLELGIINVWMVIAIMIREFIITSLRLYSLRKKVILEAKRPGKHKTFSQITGIVIIFIALIISKKFPQSKFSIVFQDRFLPLIMWYIVIITIYSGIHYLWINRKAIKTY